MNRRSMSRIALGLSECEMMHTTCILSIIYSPRLFPDTLLDGLAKPLSATVIWHGIPVNIL